MISRFVRRVRQLNSDRSGMSLVYVTLALPVIMGMALLAVDVGRLHTLQSSLQHGADALALAGAGELDLAPDAITRANRAVDNLVTTNTALWSTSVVTINGGSISRCYLAAIPANDATPINTGNCLPTATPADIASSSIIARYLRVVVTPISFNTFMPASFLGGSDTATRSAEAVAGFQAAVCNFTPMFICNPYESATNTNIMENVELLNHFSVPGRKARQINMKQTGGNNAQYFPGNFGFLIPLGTDANPGASTLREYVGRVAPPACFTADGVELRTGAITSIRFGFNTRFDMYDGPMNGEKNNVDFRPAQNVRKGFKTDSGSACNPNQPNANQQDEGPSDDPSLSKLRRDTCFLTNTCTLMGGRMGDGNWDIAKYFQQAHNGATPPVGMGNGSGTSRYDIYRWELATAGMVTQDSNGTGTTGGEVGDPKCSTAATSDNPDRRIFNAAILNCRALDTSATYGPIRGGSNNKLPVVAFGRFFLTEPVDGGGNVATADGDVWAELVGLEKPGEANSVARDIVQLYR